jgi:2-dehydro-3-deoxygluconokinase
MVELRGAGEDLFSRSYAGDVYNTAVYLKRSLPEAQVQFLTATGTDATSQTMRKVWRLQGIDDALAFTLEDALPGLYLIETNALGERRFEYWRSNSAARAWFRLLQAHGESVLHGADIIYFSGISLAILPPEERAAAIEMLRRARPHLGRIVFDPNVRLALWESAQCAAQTITEALSICDIALPSAEDIERLFKIDTPELQAQLLREFGVQELAITMGSSGCLIETATERLRLPAAATRTVVDTSGAGDAFNGAYLAGRLQRHSLQQAAQAGLLLGTRVITHAGAIVPTWVSHPKPGSD